MTSYAFSGEGRTVDRDGVWTNGAMEGHWATPDRYHYTFEIEEAGGRASGEEYRVGGKGAIYGIDDWRGSDFGRFAVEPPSSLIKPLIWPLEEPSLERARLDDGTDVYVVSETFKSTSEPVPGQPVSVNEVGVTMAFDQGTLLIREKHERFAFTAYESAEAHAAGKAVYSTWREQAFRFADHNAPVNMELPDDFGRGRLPPTATPTP